VKAYYYWIAAIVIALDQIVKQVIVARVDLHEQISVIGNFFLITHILNPGAAFGILKGASVFFIIVTTLVVSGIIWFMERNKGTGSKLMLTALGLVLGGAIGNFIDRLLHGEVVDFLQFNFGSYTFPIFNLADSAIVCGVALILLDAILTKEEPAAEVSEQDGEVRNHGSESLASSDKPIN
jgi:signal peptidase II